MMINSPSLCVFEIQNVKRTSMFEDEMLFTAGEVKCNNEYSI